jgi:hypothetical protein
MTVRATNSGVLEHPAQPDSKLHEQTSVTHDHTDLCEHSKCSCCQHPVDDDPHLDHKQVLIRHGDTETEVEEELAPLIQALWNAGIDTALSCQENLPGIAWIMFPTFMDAEMFLTLVAQYPELGSAENRDPERFCQTLYARVKRHGSGDNWVYRAHIDDLARDFEPEDAPEHSKPSDMCFSLSVQFPRSDLPLVLERVQRRSQEEWYLSRSGQLSEPAE